MTCEGNEAPVFIRRCDNGTREEPRADTRKKTKRGGRERVSCRSRRASRGVREDWHHASEQDLEP